MKLIHIKIVTPEKIVFEDDMEAAILPTVSGEITVLPQHIALISTLASGEIILKKNNQETSLVVSGGFIELNNNTLNILADMAERAEDIDAEKAQEARQKAEDLKKQAKIMDDQEYTRVSSMIERETARLKVAKKHHSKHNININHS